MHSVRDNGNTFSMLAIALFDVRFILLIVKFLSVNELLFLNDILLWSMNSDNFELKIMTSDRLISTFLVSCISIFIHIARRNNSSKMHPNRELFLIGHLQPEISVDKLPSNREVLSVFCYHSPNMKDNSVNFVCSQIKSLWIKAGIPLSRDNQIKRKINSLYKKYRRLQKLKNRNKKSQSETKNLREFREKLDNLFDVAHANALKILKHNKIQKEFLLSQRKKNRVGCLSEVAPFAEASLSKKLKREEKEENRKRKHEIASEQMCK